MLKNSGLWLGLLSLAYFVAYPFLYFSFLGNPLIDYGGELFTYWRVTAGDALYRDLFQLYGPFPILLQSLGYAMGGRAGMVGVNLLAALSTIVCLVFLFRRHASAGFLGLAIFFLVFFFGANQLTLNSNYNFFTPYKSAALYGLLCSLLAMAFLVRALLTPGRGLSLAAGVFTALCFLSKQEYFGAVVGATALLALGQFWAKEAIRLHWRIFGAAFVATVTTGLAIFSWQSGLALREAAGGFFRIYRVLLDERIVGQAFYRQTLGGNSLVGTFVLLGVLGGAWLASFVVQKKRWWTAIAIGVGLAVIFWDPAFDGALASFDFYSGLPLVALVLFLLAGLVFFRRREVGLLALVVFFLYATLLTAKTFLSFRLAHYGFSLGPPAFLALLLGVSWLAGRLRLARGERVTQAFVAALLVLGAAQALASVRAQGMMRAQRPITVNAGGTSFRVSVQNAAFLAMVSKEIRRAAPAPANVLILPDGAVFNWITQIPQPKLSFNTLYPDQFLYFGEENVLTQLEAARPEFVVLLSTDLSEYQMGSFAAGYGQAVAEWVRKNYKEQVPSEDQPLAAQFGVSFWRLAR